MGAGQGAYSFELQSDKKVMVRRNNSAYASGSKHKDLLIVFV